VLIHVDSQQAHPNLINSRTAYVSFSRARYDAHIYTNDKANLGEELSREVSHRSAIQQGARRSRSRAKASCPPKRLSMRPKP